MKSFLTNRQCYSFTNVITWNTFVVVGLYFIFRITDSYYALPKDGQYNQPACVFRAYRSLLNISSNKNPNQHKRNRYDWDIRELSDEDNDYAEYQSGDFIRGRLFVFLIWLFHFLFSMCKSCRCAKRRNSINNWSIYKLYV